MIRSIKEVENWDFSQKEAYYKTLREKCENRKKKPSGCNKIIYWLAPHLRSFPLEIRGEENIPKDTTVLFVCNHSNSHDFFVMKEALMRVGRHVMPLAASDSLNALSRFIFYLGDSVLFDRTDKASIEKGILDFCGKILNGRNGFIFGESTWNLHPTAPMQKVKAGAVQVALITGKPIVPVIFEYVEVPKICDKENELYSKCVIQFGKPIYASLEESIFAQSDKIQSVMESMRRDIWKEFDIKKSSIDQVDKDIYLNHLYLKKYKATGFKFDSEYELRFLLEKENEYILDEEGRFVPGILKE